ncbi:MAG: hypothetical protein D3926_15730 [Desulfobacteraceae bacterium]|nr:MAG: hypothetical protein D3926_15730 [Desulfobacteraceae bacterium]
MKHRFMFETDEKNAVLTVLESGEVDPGVYLPLHEESYDLDAVKETMGAGLDEFMRLFRRKNFFPTRDLCAKFYKNLPEFISNADERKLVLEYDDAESFPKIEIPYEDDVELDMLLDEDGDTKEDEIKEIDDEDDTPRFTPEDTSEHEN